MYYLELQILNVKEVFTDNICHYVAQSIYPAEGVIAERTFKLDF